MQEDGGYSINKEAVVENGLREPQPNEVFLHTLLVKEKWKQTIKGIASRGVIRSKFILSEDAEVPSGNIYRDYELQTSIVSPQKTAVFQINDLTFLFTGQELAKINARLHVIDNYPGIVTRYSADGDFYGAEVPLTDSYLAVNFDMPTEDLEELFTTLQEGKNIPPHWVRQRVILCNKGPEELVALLQSNPGEIQAEEWSNTLTSEWVNNLLQEIPSDLETVATQLNKDSAVGPVKYNLFRDDSLEIIREKGALLLEYNFISSEDYQQIIAKINNSRLVREDYYKLFKDKNYYYDTNQRIFVYLRGRYDPVSNLSFLSCDSIPEISSKKKGSIFDEEEEEVTVVSKGEKYEVKFGGLDDY